MSSMRDWTAIPDHLRPGLARYLLDGIKPGDFLCSVLRNDLAGAVCRATPDSLVGIKPIILFLHWHVNRQAYGSSGCIEVWRDMVTRDLFEVDDPTLEAIRKEAHA